MTVREGLERQAFAALQPAPPWRDYNRRLWQQMKPGQNGVDGSAFNHCRVHPDKPSPTVPKSCVFGGFSSLYHWSEPRSLSIGELAALTSFPDDFLWPADYEQAHNRIGNSVPPRLTQAIAEVLRDEVLGTDRFTYISTFAGCGGSSLGYKWAGGRGLAAVEFDANAVATYRANFPDTPVIDRDIAKVTAEELMEVARIGVGQLDILDGSPPCQGFSTAGKRVITDPRNSLFREYVRLIEGLQPRVFVMENVSGMVKGKMKLVFREVMLALKATGYDVRCKLLNAMYFNVPQSRERLIWIGVRPDVEKPPTFPKAQGTLRAGDSRAHTRRDT
jgi:site-specific DNA-cytosine methylase